MKLIQLLTLCTLLSSCASYLPESPEHWFKKKERPNPLLEPPTDKAGEDWINAHYYNAGDYNWSKKKKKK